MDGIEVRDVSGGVGAEIAGVDLSKDISRADMESMQQALWQNGVLFFRDQDLEPEDHIRFAERWGKINVNRFFAAVKGYPQIAEVRKEADQVTNIGGGWHTDHSYDQIPAMGSVLLAREVPETGGDTLFANMYVAYEVLSEGMKKALEGLKAVHSSRHVFGRVGELKEHSDIGERIGNPKAATQDAIHPVIITHPESGRKALYVNGGFTLRFDGWTEEESQPLLRYLYAHASKPEFTTRFQWRKGSIAMWDNRSTWHYALNDYHGQRRLMHRITIEGCPLS